jgi:hypothetical protein
MHFAKHTEYKHTDMPVSKYASICIFDVEESILWVPAHVF